MVDSIVIQSKVTQPREASQCLLRDRRQVVLTKVEPRKMFELVERSIDPFQVIGGQIEVEKLIETSKGV